MICFSLLISFTIGFSDYQKGQRRILSDYKKIDKIGNIVVQSLHTIDQVYSITEEKMAREIEENLNELIEEYKENPSVKKIIHLMDSKKQMEACMIPSISYD